MTIYLTPPAGGGGVANVASGTTTVEGTVRLATTVEAQDVNNETLAVTPKGLNAQIASAIAGGVTYEGTIAGDNIPTLTTATKGQLYKIDTASSGVVAGFNWSINDSLLINADMGGTFDANKINKIDSTDSDLATVASSGSYNDLSDKPSIPSASTDLTDTATLVRTADLATVATTGSYNDLLNQPTIPTNSTDLGDSADLVRTIDLGAVATSNDYNDLDNKPSIPSASTDLTDTATLVRTTDLATVATSGSYNDLLNQPTIPSASTDLTDTATLVRTTDLATVATTGSYADLLNTPTIPSSSDDLTSDHNPTNYQGALNGSLTTHLAGIDTALGNALSGTTDSIIEGQAKVETIDTGSDARIEFSADPNGTGTEKIWEFNSSGHLIPNVNDTYDIGSAEKKVRDLYLGSSTLYMGGTLSLGVVDGNLRLSGGGNLEVGTATVLTDATLPSIPESSADLSDGADLLKIGDKGVAIGDVVEVIDVGGSVAGISALDGSNLTNLTYANITGTPTLATVATSGDYNDLTNKPSVSTVFPVSTATTSATATVNTAVYFTSLGTNACTLTLPPISTASDGDVVIVVRQYAGSLTIQQNGADSGTLIRYLDAGIASSHTITNNQQQIHIRYDAGSGDPVVGQRWYIYDKAQALVATTGDYTDLSNVPTDSDDFTANLNPTNYLNVNNTDTITAHLSAIDTALGNVGGGGASGYPTSLIGTSSLSASANQAYIFSQGGTTTPTVTLPDNTSLNDGDVVILSRAYTGQITLNQFDQVEATSRIYFFNFGATKTRTIDCNRQQIHIRWSQGDGRWYLFDYPQSDVAVSGDYNDLINTPTDSDDFTANLNPTNYQGVNNTNTITAHLGAIDNALGNVVSAPTVTVDSATTTYPTSGTLASSGIEQVYLLTPTNNTTVNLAPASTCGSGFKYHIKNMASGFTLTIDADGSETIDGVGNLTATIANQYEALTLVTDGSNWFII